MTPKQLLPTAIVTCAGTLGTIVAYKIGKGEGYYAGFEEGRRVEVRQREWLEEQAKQKGTGR